MVTFLYSLVIYPIRLILECCYTLLCQILKGVPGKEGIAVIALSFLVTLMTIPLYMIAEKWSEKERNIQNNLASAISRIKTCFKGDEQYMMLTTLYRQNHYHPIMALRSSFSILIQVPFFMAAYSFLSHLEPLKGVSFLFIKDFGSPDATFKIGSFAINILPIAMTLINCISGFVYSKGHRLGEKLQIYGCALLFLVILYDSPSGLVVYWTMNNILSLVKNIFYKLKNPKKVLYIICCISAFLLIISDFTVLKSSKNIYRLAIFLFAAMLAALPVLIKAFKFFIDERFLFLEKNPKLRLSIFVLSVVGLALLSGFFIPSTLMQSEPEQFSYVDGYTSPFVFLWPPLFQSLGIFLFWPCCLYALFSNRVKKNMSMIFCFLLFLATVNCFAFSGKYGPIETTLYFMQPQNFTTPLFTVVNILAIIALVALFNLILRFKPTMLPPIALMFVASFSILSIKNCISIKKAFKNIEPPVALEKPEPIYHLSRNGKNVLVIMQDRLITGMLPTVFEERPDLKKRLDGFVYYPNTASMGDYTMFGAPGLFGGYDYTPYYINKAQEKTLQQKHNEALLTIPVLFSNAGWNATVSDLPYENFLEQPTAKMYENYPEINHYCVWGTISDIWYQRNNREKTNYVSEMCKRNFVFFSIFKMVSPFLRRIVYERDYWIADDGNFDETAFIDNYSQLDLITELFDDKSEKNSLNVIVNEVTHRPMLLQAPDYVPQKEITNHGTSKYNRNSQYHVVIASLLRWADFFDYLKEQNLYDNTRIIVVSDHGIGGGNNLYKETGKLPFPIQKMTASLLVKDFNSRGELSEDMTFMTNADTPYIAAKGLIDDLRNPFTKNPLMPENKFERTFVMDAQPVSTRTRHEKAFKIHGFYKIKDNIFDEENWSLYDGE